MLIISAKERADIDGILPSFYIKRLPEIITYFTITKDHPGDYTPAWSSTILL
jgi:hypothetical protein